MCGNFLFLLSNLKPLISLADCPTNENMSPHQKNFYNQSPLQRCDIYNGVYRAFNVCYAADSEYILSGLWSGAISEILV